jgi:type II secretory pathway component PulK
MTRERRITILLLIATLVVGLLIGMLTSGLVHTYRGGMHRGRRGPDHGDEGKKEWFVHTINRIVQPDSIQADKIKPITSWASQQIEALEISSNVRMSEILDSVRVQLKPILTEEQQQRLSEFQDKAQGTWKGRRR